MIIILFLLLLLAPLVSKIHFSLEWNIISIATCAYLVYRMPKHIAILIGPILIGAILYLNVDAIYAQWAGAQLFLDHKRATQAIFIIAAAAIPCVLMNKETIKRSLCRLFYVIAIAIIPINIFVNKLGVPAHNVQMLTSLCCLLLMFTKRRTSEFIIMWAVVLYIRSTTPLIVALFIQCLCLGLAYTTIVMTMVPIVLLVSYWILPDFIGGPDRWIHYNLYLDRWWAAIIKVYAEDGKTMALMNAHPWVVRIFGWGGTTFGYWGPLQGKSIGVNNFYYLWAHSDWLQIMLEYGIAGLLFVLTMYYRLLWYVRFEKELFGFLFGFALIMVTYFPLHNPFCFTALLLVIKTIPCKTNQNISMRTPTQKSVLYSLNKTLSTT